MMIPSDEMAAGFVFFFLPPPLLFSPSPSIPRKKRLSVHSVLKACGVHIQASIELEDQSKQLVDIMFHT
jgi:hypothetical protein